MRLNLSCPKCSHEYTIELVKAQRLIDDLRKERDRLRAEVDRLRNDSLMFPWLKDAKL